MIQELNYVNGQDCGSGYDVCAYIDDKTDGAAAMIKHLPTREVRYVDLSGLDADEVERICTNYANGGSFPAESEEGAESLWGELDTASGGGHRPNY